jgi:hypothetical protein
MSDTKRFFCSLFFLLFTTQVWAQPTGMQSTGMQSSVKPSSKIEGKQFLERPAAKPPATKTPLPPRPTPPTPLPQQATYLRPGILIEKGGRWEGGDHLLNLPAHIGVYVTIVKPKTEVLTLSEEQIKKEVEALFQEASIQPITLALPGKPPLPAFQVEILLYPIEKGYTACCVGRLFESITLERFKPAPRMTFQAITWEQQALIVGPASQFDQQVIKQVKEIVHAFTERFQTYQRIKNSDFK